MQATNITGATGTLTATLWRDVPDLLTIDASFDLNIAFNNQQARLRFNGTAGQNLGVNISPLTLGASTVQVLGPSGAPIAIGPQASGGQISVAVPAGTVTGISMQALPATGTYTVLVVPNSGATDGRATTSTTASGDARRMSAIAGSAITASPSQFGAKTATRFRRCTP